MIHESVVFDFYSDDFQKYENAWDPKVVSKHQHQFLENGKYIKGVIDSKIKKSKGSRSCRLCNLLGIFNNMNQ